MKKVIQIVCVAVVVVSLGSIAVAEVNIETVPVGNPGNAGELSGASVGGRGPDRICGAVAYKYNIGKYEVTAGQYCEFLNAVAKTDTYGLYNSGMVESDGCQITQDGRSGNYTYDFSGRPGGDESDWVDRPVNYVSFWDAARFANWLHNGQPVGPQDLTTTEDGAYTLTADGISNNTVTRNAGAQWAVTSEDEWYKAAYYSGSGGTYYDYATGTDSASSNDLVEPTDPGNNATFYQGDYTIGGPYHRTEFGAHENSESPYETFDQGGNVHEWNDTITSSRDRGLRGGSFAYSYHTLLASFGGGFYPDDEDSTIGFRVSEVPEPATMTMLTLGGLTLVRRRKRRACK
ncbi:MAG: SUMF1/EgtB/PvdO family nonheme iron enzyme [Phycisphaerae bacterium]|jgi:formylglycine-generating enzyme required for sulfatase activity|nr:SUMF1/EgtB/PvdO family nonheme iron enzyme [Phycisphaerae bacterium]